MQLTPGQNLDVSVLPFSTYSVLSSNEDPSAATCSVRDKTEHVCNSGETSITFKYFNPFDECDLQFFCGSITGNNFSSVVSFHSCP